jgi:hypothetical protein
MENEITSINTNSERIPPASTNRIGIDVIIEVVFDKFSSGIRFIGPIFAFALTLFVLIVAHAYFHIVVPYYISKISVILGVICFFCACYCLFSILLNYFLAVLVRPGSLKDFNKSKYYKKNDPLRVSKSIFDLESIFENSNNKRLSSNDTEFDVSIDGTDKPQNDCNDIYSVMPKDCKYCKSVKPVRSHHCSICGYCVMKMDHHCPWINNCVGQNNHRYFVLFLTHLMFGCLLVSTTSIPLVFNSTIKKTMEFQFVSILTFVGFILMIFFNSWNWFLIINGNTTIEYWTKKSGVYGNLTPIKDFSFPDWRDNMFLVFGTRSLLRAIFIPNIKKLPISGLEWTKLAFPGYNLDIIDPELNVSDEKGLI